MRVAVCLLAAVGFFAVAVSASMAAKPGQSSGVDFWGQPSRSAEVYDRPLGMTVALFRSSGLAAHLPTPQRLMPSLEEVAARFRGNPGALLLKKARRVVTAAGAVYLVPTARGWVCIQGTTFATCHHGLLRQGVTWNYYSTPNGLDVIGVAADDVRSVTLVWGGHQRLARLARNVFYVHRPLTVASVRHLPPLGRLRLAYRGKQSASVALR